jgi:hypothetical protein
LPYFFTLLLSILALPLAAQEVELYAKSVYVYKVYPHPKGYVDPMYYKNNGRDLSSLHLPREWFNRKTAQSFDGSSKAELHYGDNPTIPYMQIFLERRQLSPPQALRQTGPEHTHVGCHPGCFY